MSALQFFAASMARGERGSTMNVNSVLAVVGTLVFAASASAQSSKEYAVMGRTTWAAFECSVLASKMRDQPEQERLFNTGYRAGLAFIAAAQAKKVERADLSSEVPLGLLLLLQGPTPDFMLGRVFEAAQDEALKGIQKSADQVNPDDVQRTLAQSKFGKQNCRLIGNGR